jgi:hypothetical protein
MALLQPALLMLRHRRTDGRSDHESPGAVVTDDRSAHDLGGTAGDRIHHRHLPRLAV